MCINFSTKKYFTNFLSCLSICVLWCQLPHPPVVSIIVVYKNKANKKLHPRTCRISLIYFLHIFTIIKVIINFKKENT